MKIIVDIDIENRLSDLAFTEDDVKYAIYRRLQGYDYSVKGTIIVKKIKIKGKIK